MYGCFCILSVQKKYRRKGGYKLKGANLRNALFYSLAGNDCVNVVKFFKRAVCIIMALFIAIVKNFVGKGVNRAVYSAKCRIVIGIKIVFDFSFDDLVIGGNNFCRFISGICVTFLFKVTHDLRSRLVEAFIG